MDLREMFFRFRGYTPIPFLLIALIWAQFDYSIFFIGLLISLSGELLRIKSIQYAGGATRTRQVGAPELVINGPYGQVRNPLYLANMAIYFGYSLASGALFPYLPLVIFIFFTIQYSLIISLEEETLTNIFGDAYKNYCKSTPRLFPSLKSKPYSPPNYSLKTAIHEERSTLNGFILSWILLILRFTILQNLKT